MSVTKRPRAFSPRNRSRFRGRAGTPICAPGPERNDLNYRGYDILDIAEHAEFEEIAYLLIHVKLSDAAERAATRRAQQLRVSRRWSGTCSSRFSERHPMDVMRTGCSPVGTVLPRRRP